MAWDPPQTQALALAAQLGGPLLGLDASDSTLSVCLVDPHRAQVQEPTTPAAALPSESLAQLLASLFQAQHVKVSDLRAVVVGLGPGSFTGLRVALATAKGLVFGSRIPLHGVSSLAVRAASGGVGWVAPVLPSRRTDVFGALYHVKASGKLHVCIPEGVYTPAQLNHKILDQKVSNVRLIGEGAPLCLAALPKIEDACIQHAPSRILWGLIVCQEALLGGTPCNPVSEMVPRYLRPSAAER